MKLLVVPLFLLSVGLTPLTSVAEVTEPVMVAAQGEQTSQDEVPADKKKKKKKKSANGEEEPDCDD